MPSEQTKTVVDNHMKSLEVGDIDALMADYASDAVMIANMGGAAKGVDAIRAVFSNIPPGGFSGVEITSAVFEGEVGYIVWKTAGIPLGTDTFVVRDGKIVAQTVLLHFG